MKSVPSPSLICAGLMLSVLSTFADTVTLKSGEVLNGTIVSDTDQEIVMDVTISSGISDQKTVAKADVQTVTKTTAAQTAFAEIDGLDIGPNSMALAGYDPVIKSLETFIAQHPQSEQAAVARTKIEAFKKEQAQVKEGNLKWDNRWYTPEEIEKNKAFLGSQMLLATMKEQAGRRDFIAALNSFSVFEKSYPGSRAFPDAVELAQAQIRVAAADMERIRTMAKIQEDQFNSGVLLAGEPQKSQMLAARKSQIAAADAAMAAAERTQVKWKPILPLSKKSLETLKSTLTAEAGRIINIPLADLRKSLAATAAAKVALDARNADEAEAQLKEAQALWKENEQVAPLQAKIKHLREELKRQPKPTTASGAAPGSATATTSGTTSDGAPAAPAPTPKAKRWYEF